MSWDIVLFNSRQKIGKADEIDDSQLEPTDFGAAIEQHFEKIIPNGNAREIIQIQFGFL